MRDYRKFFTCPETARFMAEILDAKDFETVLEPSAGSGALILAVKQWCSRALCYAVEKDMQWLIELRKFCDVPPYIMDFLHFTSQVKFDKCIANPPFGNGVDLQAHVRHMMTLTKQGGRIVVLVPADFELHNVMMDVYPLQNWSKNSDGTTTLIKLISFTNP